MKKQYSINMSELEKKLGRVMERLGVTQYQSDWTQTKTGVVAMWKCVMAPLHIDLRTRR